MIDDPTKVFKIIKETEVEEGYGGKMDLLSLVTSLAPQPKSLLIEALVYPFNCVSVHIIYLGAYLFEQD